MTLNYWKSIILIFPLKNLRIHLTILTEIFTEASYDARMKSNPDNFWDFA